MDDIFDNFRTDIEDITRPWTSSSLWSWPHPSTELYREGGGEEIIPSKVSAKMNNGILQIELPKKMPAKLEEKEATKIEIK